MACLSGFHYLLPLPPQTTPSQHERHEGLEGDAKDALTKKLRTKFVQEELPKYMGYFTDMIKVSLLYHGFCR